MIIQALCAYHDILFNEDQGALPKEGYSKVKVSFALVLSPDGEIVNVIDLRSDGKKAIPKTLDLPLQEVRSSGVTPHRLCDNAKYVFGVERKPTQSSKAESTEEAPIDNGSSCAIVTDLVTPRSLKCFEQFRSLHHEILDGLPSGAAKALLSYLDNWEPKKFCDQPKLRQYSEDILSGGNFVFEFNGEYIHDDKEIRQALEMSKDAAHNSEGGILGQCLVSGAMEPLSRLHQKIKGVPGAQPSGASLVSFNDAAFCSYGKEQNFNAPIGDASALKYTSILNRLLDHESKNKIQIDNTTIVFWAETKDTRYVDMASFLLDPRESKRTEKFRGEGEELSTDSKTVRLIGDILKKVKISQPLEQKELGINPETTNFYVLGLSPNSGRLSVRFWYQDSVGHFIERLAKHHLDMDIEHDSPGLRYVSSYGLLKETVPKNSKDSAASPLLGGALMRAILEGTSYPRELYAAILNRIKADGVINYPRAAFIKAYLKRLPILVPNNDKEGWITVGLNEDSSNVPYRLGRLFAVLEKAQRDVIKGSKSGINSKYFSSASTTPSVVFPVLLKLAQHHISKSDWGIKTNQSIEEIMTGIDCFPKYLELEEQGMFMIGYYHQHRALYKKRVDDGQKEEST